MEGFSRLNYKGKEIFYVNYSKVGADKEKAVSLLKFCYEEYKRLQLPAKSILALSNVENLRFDMDILNIFKEEREKTIYYEKKVAIIGVNGLLKVAYNFVISITQKGFVQVFNSEVEAKEWLVS